MGIPLQAELGEDQANAIIRKALGDVYRKAGEKWWQAKGSSNVGESVASAFEMYAAGDALDYTVIKKSPDAFEINVTGCRYAQFYKELGVPELGRLRWQCPAHPDADHHARRHSLRLPIRVG